MKKVIALTLALSLPMVNWAQCAMCRSQVASNVTGGGDELGKALNFGILYLFFTPYVALGIIALLWFRYSKIRNASKVRFS